MSVPAVVRRHPLATFFGLSLTLSWAYWIPLALHGGHRSHFRGLLGPMVAALITTVLVDGRSGLIDLLRRMGRWRVGMRWHTALNLATSTRATAPVAAAVALTVILWAVLILRSDQRRAVVHPVEPRTHTTSLSSMQ